MKHFGDITKLSGYDLPIVDCITGGSPCQDLSVAGKPNKWEEHPVAFKNLDDAERYAMSLYKTGFNARVVDIKYRKGRHNVAE